MAATRLADVIVPVVFNGYTREKTATLSNLWTSGIVAPVSELSWFVGRGGNTLTMPFWHDLSGNSQVVSADGTELTVSNITSDSDAAVVLARGNAWGSNELAAALAGSDPMMAIADAVAAWWARDMQSTLLAILEGLFKSSGALVATHLHDISAVTGAQAIGGEAIMDAMQKMGDAKDKLTAIMMHSATETALAKQNLIDYIRVSDAEPRVAFYMGKRIITSDSMPVSSGTYDTYLFGPGAIGFADGSNSKVTETETDRNTLSGEDILVNRRHFVLHPRGVKYVGAASGGGPTNTVLATAASWSRVYEPKNIRVVCLRHKLVNS
jgi:hypothetical protein